MFVCASGWALCFHETLWQFCQLVFFAVLLDFIVLGVLVASFFWFVANRYLLKDTGNHSITVHQRVEWLYAFDVHCNAYFPLFLILYVLQYFLTPFLLGNANGTVCGWLSSVMYGVAFSYYHYITFLGYDALPFLRDTQRFLVPVAVVWVCTLVSVLVGFNPTRTVLSMYFYR